MNSGANPVLEARSRWRKYLRDVDDGTSSPSCRIGVAASFTVDPLLPYIGSHCLEQNLKLAISAAPFNQLFQVCADPKSAFPDLGGEPNVIVMLWRLEDLMAREVEQIQQGDTAALERAEAKAKDFALAIKSLNSHFEGRIIVSTPPYPLAVSTDITDVRNPFELGRLHRAVVSVWVAEMELLSKVHLIDLDAIQRMFGIQYATDYRKWYLYRQPYTDNFLLLVARQITRVLMAGHRAAKKCIVLDCDNTLWGGIVGEDGVGGIQLGDEFPGAAYRDFQLYLRHLRQRGVMLALASKNNEADVWDVFNKHDGMVLSQDDISAWRINWEPKSSSIEAIAAELNIAKDSIVFIDDNPFETEQVGAALPDVHCITLPEEPADILTSIGGHALFDQIEVTSEDRLRTDRMAMERKRESAREGLSPEMFLDGLELCLSPFEVKEEHLDRVAQLINKTNQFNLTTRRRSVDEVRMLLKDDTFHIFATRIDDRFGEYGLTGVAIVKETENLWQLDTFLMSCRVLGRGAESGFLSYVVGQAQSHNVSRFEGNYIPTRKNKPAEHFLSKHGFVPTQSGDAWFARFEDILPPPAYIRVDHNPKSAE